MGARNLPECVAVGLYGLFIVSGSETFISGHFPVWIAGHCCIEQKKSTGGRKEKVNEVNRMDLRPQSRELGVTSDLRV